MLVSKSRRVVIFDFYNTLVEVDVDRPSMATLLNSLGYHCSAELEGKWNSDAFDGCETPSHTCIPDYWAWRFNNLLRMAEEAGVEAIHAEGVVGKLLHNDKTWTVKARPGALELISYLVSQEMAIGICSNWDYDIEIYLKQAGLLNITHVVTSAEVGARKPHPKPFLEIARRFSVSPHEAYFVGDNWKSDIEGALRVGMKPIWISQYAKTNTLPHLVMAFESLTAFQNRIKHHAL